MNLRKKNRKLKLFVINLIGSLKKVKLFKIKNILEGLVVK